MVWRREDELGDGVFDTRSTCSTSGSKRIKQSNRLVLFALFHAPVSRRRFLSRQLLPAIDPRHSPSPTIHDRLCFPDTPTSISSICHAHASSLVFYWETSLASATITNQRKSGNLSGKKSNTVTHSSNRRPWACTRLAGGHLSRFATPRHSRRNYPFF